MCKFVNKLLLDTLSFLLHFFLTIKEKLIRRHLFLSGKFDIHSQVAPLKASKGRMFANNL